MTARTTPTLAASLPRHFFALLTGLLLFLAGCGGGGGAIPAGTGSPPDPGNPVGPGRSRMGGSIQGTPLSLSGTTTTIAGNSLTGSEDGTGDAARFYSPRGVAVVGGYLYVVDTYNHAIRRIEIATGAVSTFAGSAESDGAVDGPRLSARFNGPRGIATDGVDLYVADTFNHTIRKIAIATGEVTTIAGSAGALGWSDGTGPAAAFNYPSGIAIDGAGLYVSDTYNHAIRRIAIATGTVTTIAGTMRSEGTEDGVGAAARFQYPDGIATDGANLYVADTENSSVRRIAIATGEVTTFAGSSGTTGSTDGFGPAARFYNPWGIATDGENLYVAEIYNSTIRKISIATGEVTTIAGAPGEIGNADGPGTDARFNFPVGIATDGVNLYVSEMNNHAIRKISLLTGEVSRIAGSQGSTGSADGSGTAARFDLPGDVTTDGTNLYVTDKANRTIRRVSVATGAVTTIAGTAGTTGSTDGSGAAARFRLPIGITTDGANLYVADMYNNAIRRISIATGEVTTIAGAAGTIGATDGVGTAARFNDPAGITTDGANLYVADLGNHAIRRIAIATGEVSTIAGYPGASGSIDGTGMAARFHYPFGITTDGVNLYVSDHYNHTIRRIAIATREVATIAGTPGVAGSADGTGTAARFYDPRGITTDGANLYVADMYNNAIRRISIATWEVTTVAGMAGTSGSIDGSGTYARFRNPVGITTDGNALFVSDSTNNTIRKIR